MCGKQDITIIDHIIKIDIKMHLSESNNRLNKSRTIEFTKHLCDFFAPGLI